MNDLLKMLSGGDLRSDGNAEKVAEIVLENPALFEDLFAGLSEQDDIIRGRTAHALEKISRTQPEWFLPKIDGLLELASQDSLPFTCWHYAMLFTNLAVYPDLVDRLVAALTDLLEDNSVFVRSWAITGLTVIARFYPQFSDQIIKAVEQCKDDKSPAIRSKVRNAMPCLLDGSRPLPKGWLKSQYLLEKSTGLR